jgi:hypothetical protein
MAEDVEQARLRFEAQLTNTITSLVPNTDFSEGTVLKELVINPAAIAHAERVCDLEEVRDTLSLVQVLAEDDSDPTLVDNLLSNFNVVRREGSRATGLINIYTQDTRNIHISETAIFVCGGVELRPTKAFVGVNGEITTRDTESVSYIQVRQFDATTFVFSITATTIENIDTVLSPGQACSMTPANSLVDRIETGSTFTGGTLPENNSQLLQRASVGLSARMLSGKIHIQSLLSSSEDVNILDLAVFGMGDELMLRDAANNGRLSSGGTVDVYVKTAPVPSVSRATLTGTRNSDGDFEIEIPQSEFPGAYGVERIFFQENLINTNIVPTLGFTVEDDSPLITEVAHARYSKFQTLLVTFEATSVQASVTETEFEVDILFMPGIAAVQDIVEDPDIKNRSFDTLVKGVIPVFLNIRVEVTYQQGAVAPTVDEATQAVCDAVNGKLVGTEKFLSSDVVFALKELFSLGDVQMPVYMMGKAFMPDGSVVFTSSTNFIKPPTATGISFENSSFFCLPADVEVTLTEIPV